MRGHAKRLDAHIVNYADDFVIGCKPGTAEKAMAAMRGMMEKLRLTVNETKTRCCGLPDGTRYGQPKQPRHSSTLPILSTPPY